MTRANAQVTGSHSQYYQVYRQNNDSSCQNQTNSESKAKRHILTFVNYSNSPFYSCVFSDLALPSFSCKCGLPVVIEQHDLHEKISEVCMKTSSPLAFYPFTHKVTQHTTVKRTICFLSSFNFLHTVYLFIFFQFCMINLPDLV